MAHDENEYSIRPRINGTARKEKSPSLRSLKMPKAGNQKNWRSAAAVRPSHPFARRVIIKARIVKMNAYGQKAAAMHIRYIERGEWKRTVLKASFMVQTRLWIGMILCGQLQRN